MNIDEANHKLRMATGVLEPVKELLFPFICLEDFQHDYEIEPFVTLGEYLKFLEGKRIVKITWECRPDKADNPRGSKGRFVIQYTA